MLPLKQVRDQSRSKDKQIAKFITDRIGDLRLFEATIPRAQLLLDTLAREGYRDRPKKVRNLAQQIWHDPLVRQAVRSNPWLQTKTPPRTVVRTKGRALTEPQLVEVRRIVAEWCAPPSDGTARLGPRRGMRLMLALDLMAVTGLRIGEVLALRACDMVCSDEDGSAITSVTGTIVSGDSGVSPQEDPKTATSNARITVPPFIAKRWQTTEPAAQGTNSSSRVATASRSPRLRLHASFGQPSLTPASRPQPHTASARHSAPGSRRSLATKGT